MLKTSEQLEAYKAVKAELKYGRVDPLVKDLRLVELATRTVADRVEQFMDDLVVKRKHRVVAITLGSLLAVSFVCAYFARKGTRLWSAPARCAHALLSVDNLIFYAAKTLSLTLFVRVTFILPFSWRYPQVLPHLLAVVLDPIKVRHARDELYRRSHPLCCRSFRVRFDDFFGCVVSSEVWSRRNNGTRAPSTAPPTTRHSCVCCATRLVL